MEGHFGLAGACRRSVGGAYLVVGRWPSALPTGIRYGGSL